MTEFQSTKPSDNQLNMHVFVEQMALIVNLKLRNEYKEGVTANFERIYQIAQLVNEFPLPEEIEAATVFEP